MESFEKAAGEQYPIAMDFASKLSSGDSLASGTVGATDNGVDASAAVLGSTVAGISGSEAIVTVKNGTAGHEYLITFTMTTTLSNILVGSLMMYVTSAAVGVSLSDYLLRTRRLLHDSTAVYWQDTELTDYINQALQQVAARCKQIRKLQSFSLTAHRSVYPFSSLSSPGTLDVLGIVVIWGNSRVQLMQKSFSWITTYGRPWLTYEDVPRIMCRYGSGDIFLAPTPSQNFPTEWDTVVLPVPLVNASDVDASPFPYTEPVPYYAAYLAKENQQQYDEADRFLQQFKEKVNDCPVMTMERLIESMYEEEALF